MSLNQALNATISLIENRPEQFKEALRQPTSDVKDISAVRQRLNRALNFYAATKIRTGLMDSLRCHAIDGDPAARMMYLKGVKDVEQIFEVLVDQLEEK